MAGEGQALNHLQTAAAVLAALNGNSPIPLTSPVSVPVGSAAAPSLYFTGDATTGFYSSAAGKIDVAVSGVKVGEWSATGLNGAAIGATTPAAGAFTTLSATGTLDVTGLATLTGGATAAAAVRVNRGASSDIAFSTYYTGSFLSFYVNANGNLNWGAGATDIDAVLYRSGVGTLRTDTAFSIGTTLAVSGTSTLAAVNASGALHVSASGASNIDDILVIGPASGGATSATLLALRSNGGTGIQLQFNTGAIPNWLIASQYNVDHGVEFTPSTTNGGVTYTTPVLVLKPLGSVIIGPQAALATSATDGFAYMPTCAGTPTGTPSAFTGKVAWVYDTTNNKIYVYNGAWKATAALT